MPKPSILIFTGIFPPAIGGPATYTARLADELQKNGFKIILLTFSPAPKNFNQQFNFPVFRIPITLPRLIRFWRAINFLIKNKNEYDLIYTHGGPFDSGICAIIAKLFTGKKIITKVTGDNAWELAREKNWTNLEINDFQKHPPLLRSKIFAKLRSWIIKKADYLVVPSEYLKKISMNWGVAKNKIIVIYNASEKLPSIKTSRKQLGLNEKNKIILSAGRLVPWKGFDILIETLNLLPKEISLIIAGDGPDKTHLLKLIDQLKLNNRVIFTGKLNSKKLAEYFSTCNIFVLLSRYEGLAHILLEAFAAEIPVIASDCCGNPEVIEDEFNGLLVNPINQTLIAKKINQLLTDHNLQRKFIENSKQTLKKFTWEKNITQTIKLIKKFI